MILVEHVTKRYPAITAVREVSLRLEPGRVVGLLGPNGAGKSTLIRMLVGLIAPSAGRLSILGHDTLESPLPARRAIGYLPESAPLYPEMPVDAYLRHRAELFRLPRRAARAAIDHAAHRCLLAHVRRQRIGTLSKGFRQRVGLAAAILHDPPVLILDEPASGLDPTQQQEMRSLIRDLGRTRLVLLSSHLLAEVEQVCDRVVIMARGRVRADGSPSDLLAAEAARAGYRLAARRLDAGTLAATLTRVPGVAAVRAADRAPSPDTPTVTIEPRPDAGDLREPLAAAIHSAGGVIIEFTTLAPTLEHVFQRVISTADATDAPPGPDSAPAEPPAP